MFTGLIREIGRVKSLNGNYLNIKSSHIANIGDSIAINGVCLTVVENLLDGFVVELGRETREKVAIERFSGNVHIEPAMRLSDRLDGHIVQGHIDCIGKIIDIQKLSNTVDFYIEIDSEFMKFIIPKGSIAIDGVSLTINDVCNSSFKLSIIPHTVNNTLFKNYKIYDRVNIETDMFARYIYFLFNKKPTWSDIERIEALY